MYLKYGPKCCTSGEKYKFELKKLSYKMTRAKVEFEVIWPAPPPKVQICSANFHVCHSTREVTLGEKMIGKGGGGKKWFSKLIYTPATKSCLFL